MKKIIILISIVVASTLLFFFFYSKQQTKTLTEIVPHIKILNSTEYYRPNLTVINTAHNLFRPREKIIVSYSDAPNFKDAWIGFFKAGSSYSEPIARSLLQGENGTFEVTAPNEIGKYEILIFERADSANPTAVFSDLIVATYDVHLSIDKSTVEHGQDIGIKFSNIPENVEATLAVVSANQSGYITKFLWYQTEGTIKVKAPSVAGQYFASIYIDGDPGKQVGKSDEFIVTTSLSDNSVDDYQNIITRGYYTNFCSFSFSRKGNRVEAYYDRNNGFIQGTVEKHQYDYKITGTFEESSSSTGEKYKGDIIIFLSGDAEIVKGSWRFRGDTTWQRIYGGYPNYKISGKQPIRINSEKDKMALLWDEDFQKGVIGYNIYRRLENQEWNSEPINTTLVEGLKYIDSRVRPYEKYYYMVKAVFKNGKEQEITKETPAYSGNFISFNYKAPGLIIQGFGPVNSVFDNDFSITNGNVLGLADYYANVLGIDYYWNSKEQKGLFKHNGSKVELHAGSPEMLVNGKKVTLPVSPATDDEDSLRVPLKAVFESLGYKVEWNEKDNIFYVRF